MISMYFTVALLSFAGVVPAGHRFAIWYGAAPRSSTSRAGFPDAPLSGEFQNGPRRVMPAEAGDRTAAPGAGAAQQDAVAAGGHAPALGGRAERGVIGGPRPAQVAVE